MEQTMADNKPTDNRSPEQIRADIHAARQRMSANVQGLVTEVHPTAVKNRAVDDAKEVARTEVQNLTHQVKDENGWRTDRLTLAGVASGAVMVGLLVIRGLAKLVTRKR